MLCDKCKKNDANVHCTTIINGKKQEVHLCSECAEKENFQPFSIFARDWFEDFDDMLGFDEILPCSCGTTLSQIADSGRVGCDNCSGHYKDIMSQAIESVNKGAKKKLEETKNMTEKDKIILQLRQDIADAVSKEDYETAAKLKKEIEKLQGDK